MTKLTRSFNDRTLCTRFVPDQHEPGQWARYYDDHWPTMRQPAAAHVWNRTIEPHADAPVVSLPTFSKWGPDLSTVVGDSVPLVMCGVVTECCILATAIAAADDGGEVIVLSDACRGATNHYHQQALSVMHQMAPRITVIDSAELSQWNCWPKLQRDHLSTGTIIAGVSDQTARTGWPRPRPIALISSGAKAILDISATLERFETLSVPVVGYRTDRYPGFYAADSGYPVNACADSPDDVATMLTIQRELDIPSGVLVGNPIPEAEQLDPGELDNVVHQAWTEAQREGVRGQASTPYLIDHIRRATDGRSLDANVALYRNNIRLAVEVAASLAGQAR